MTRRVVHFELEVFYETLSQPLCENQRGVDAWANVYKPVEMTADETEITCRKCLRALGYEPVPADQLTEVHGDPFARAA